MTRNARAPTARFIRPTGGVDGEWRMVMGWNGLSAIMLFVAGNWGVAPGWFEDAPLALAEANSTCHLPAKLRELPDDGLLNELVFGVGLGHGGLRSSFFCVVHLLFKRLTHQAHDVG